jgi:hypothetical protein
MMRIVQLQEAGYPLRANDLTPAEWEDLGVLVNSINDNRRKEPMPVYLIKL